MNTKPLFLSMVIAFTAPLSMPASADILSIGPQAKVLKNANMPKHGDSMKKVSSKFGNARAIKKSKGAVTKRNPRITQWDYQGFSVFFENSHVIHSVIHR